MKYENYCYSAHSDLSYNFRLKFFQALTSFALLYQYTDPSGKFGKHSKTFRDHVNFPVAITKQHNWQPISYVAQTKHTNFIFSKVNPNALKNQAIHSYTATTATDTSSLVSYAQKEEGVCEVLCNISNKDFFWTQKIQYIPRQFWIISGPLMGEEFYRSEENCQQLF